VWVMLATFPAILAVVEWAHWLMNTRPNPWISSALAVSAVVYSTYRLRATRRRLNQLTLGLQGERIVAEILDSLREKGAAVFHDIPSDGFNIDHVVISDRGVYAIETKTLSKRPRATVSFDDDGRIIVDGRRLDRDPLVQSQIAANWLVSMLKSSTGKSFSVRPVVLFPGWWVESVKSPAAPDTWVLNPKALSRFIEREPTRLQESDFRLAAYHLERYVRSAG
jgi:Nuclease-related domain